MLRCEPRERCDRGGCSAHVELRPTACARRGVERTPAIGATPPPLASSTGASATAVSRKSSGMDAARADDDDGAETRVPARADEQLEPRGDVFRRLDRERAPPRGRSTAARAASASVRPEHDPAGVGLVQRAKCLHDRPDSRSHRRPRPLRRACTVRAAPNGTPAAASAARASPYDVPATALGLRRERRDGRRAPFVGRPAPRARRPPTRSPGTPGCRPRGAPERAARPSTSCARRAAARSRVRPPRAPSATATSRSRSSSDSEL